MGGHQVGVEKNPRDVLRLQGCWALGAAGAAAAAAARCRELAGQAAATGARRASGGSSQRMPAELPSSQGLLSQQAGRYWTFTREQSPHGSLRGSAAARGSSSGRPGQDRGQTGGGARGLLVPMSHRHHRSTQGVPYLV